jgi:hypothetical protein
MKSLKNELAQFLIQANYHGTYLKKVKVEARLVRYHRISNAANSEMMWGVLVPMIGAACVDGFDAVKLF